MQTRKNLTRFTYENTAFQGWRICISRNGKTFVKYFSDKRYGSEEAARTAAEELLDKIQGVLDDAKEKYGSITKESLDEVLALIGK